MTPVLALTRNGRPLARLKLGDAEEIGEEAETVSVNELQLCGFSVEDREPDTEYRLWVGDRDAQPVAVAVPPALGRARGAVVEWADAPYFDGARGRVWVRLASRPIGSAEACRPRARLPVYVLATKLSEERYQTMLDQLRRLAAGLVFDLVSPMARRLRVGATDVGVSHRSSQLELRLLEGIWGRLSRSLREVAQDPITSIRRIREVRLSWGAERFGPATAARLSAAGIDPRSPGAPRPFPAYRERFAEDLNTVEHQVILGLLKFLRQRVASCGANIRRHIAGIEADRPFRQHPTVRGGRTLYDSEDRPRVEQLHVALARARRLACCLAKAQSLDLFRDVVPRFSLPATPIFDHVRPYRRIRDEFRRYVRSALILLEDGFEERLKSTQRLYEQWVFFQIAAAFRRAGLRCVSHDGLFHRARRFRFTLDVDRGARLTFLAPEGRAIMLRFEPWVLPHATARQRRDTVYRGTRGESPWSPDILIEFLDRAQVGGESAEVAYAVVIDAKYTDRIQEYHWDDTRKYLEIRATSTRRQVVKQLWLAYPCADEHIVPEDSAINWTANGPDCHRDETLQGRLGLLPGTSGSAEASSAPAGWIAAPEDVAQDFVRGLLAFLQFPQLGGPTAEPT
jgi:hypothetical protein